MRPVFATVAVLAALLAPPASAGAFDRGDVLASVGSPSVIARFAPDGTPKGELADSAGAGPLCLDATSEHLIAPGTGLYDDSGKRLDSAWGGVSPRGTCTVDKAGNVYVAGAPSTGDNITGRGTIRKFDLTGHPLASYDVEAAGFTYIRAVTSVDLGPDDCTIYYELGGGDQVKRYDVCSGTQLPALGSVGFPCDDLQVRADGDVLVTCDTYGRVLEASGNVGHNFASPLAGSTSLRYSALDPDGTSFWMGTLGGVVGRYDMATGDRRDSWTAGSGTGMGGFVVAGAAAPPAQDAAAGATSSGGAGTGGGGAAAQPPGHLTQAASLAAPSLAIAGGRLLTSGRSLLVDTGVTAACPAGGATCRATVTLTAPTGTARAAAAGSTVRVGSLTRRIAPGGAARLVVRLSRKGAALVRKRRALTIAVCTSVRAGGGPAVVRRTTVRLRARR